MKVKKINTKSIADINKMKEGGNKLAKIKEKLALAVKENANASDINNIADSLISKAGGKPSFKMVSGYHWATCINVNDGVVHGIPKAEIVFKKGDVVSVDLGMYYKGFHTDTSFSLGIDLTGKTIAFLDTGRRALKKAIKSARVGAKVYDISREIETEIKKDGYEPIKALVGHGIGKKLHEDPPIPCFVEGERDDSPDIPEGAVFAIEVMYTQGSGDVVVGDDGWTITTRDGKISALFEETVALTRNGPIILTA